MKTSMKTRSIPKRMISLILALALIALFATNAAAMGMRASLLIASHSCSARAGTDGEMDVTFSITGKKIMSTIGAKAYISMSRMEIHGNLINCIRSTIPV